MLDRIEDMLDIHSVLGANMTLWRVKVFIINHYLKDIKN